MKETSPELESNIVNEMRRLLRVSYYGGHRDIEVLMQFLILYDEFSRQGGELEDLDMPDIGLEFTEGMFDMLVEAYDDLGGPIYGTTFPEVEREISSDWSEELDTLLAAFESDDQRIYHPTYALYVRKHNEQLRQFDQGDDFRYQRLLTNPKFLMSLVRVYEYEEAEDAIDFPGDWPSHEDHFLTYVFACLGYKYYGTFEQDWKYTENDFDYVDNINNLIAMGLLEKQRPGAVARLSHQFGIRHFSRYPIELLMAQDENGGVVDRDYGIIMSAVDDHNRALSSRGLPEQTIVGQLYRQALPTHDVLVAEADSGLEFQLRLKYFDQLNGNTRKVDFGMFDSHGKREHMQLGSVPDALGRLAVSGGIGFMNLRNIFSPRASVLMTGCSTGQANGIAQHMSAQLGTTIIAPQIVTRTTEVHFRTDVNGNRLIPGYREGDDDTSTPIVFKHGSLLGRKNTEKYITRS